MRNACMLALISACSFQLPDPGEAPDDGNGGENPPTVECESFSTLFDTCAPSFDASDAFTLPAEPNKFYRYDGSKLELCESRDCAVVPLPARVLDEKGIDVWVVTGFELAMNSHLEVTSPRPLAIVATGAITMDGLITFNGGGDRSAAQCATSAGSPGGNELEGGGGGGGGGFQRPGSRGGNGRVSDNRNGSGGVEGAAISLDETALLGGCPGGNGGLDSGASSGTSGQGGRGGGAFYIASAVSITVGSTSRINVGGHGGGGALASDDDAGGGGGGSGGTLWLESPNILLRDNAVLAANGGGGGGGANGSDGDGVAGADGVADDATANGGKGGGDSGDGGRGDAGADASSEPGKNDGGGANSDGGGGGGGGGAGFIRLDGAVDAKSVISPPPILSPGSSARLTPAG